MKVFTPTLSLTLYDNWTGGLLCGLITLSLKLINILSSYISLILVFSLIVVATNNTQFLQIIKLTNLSGRKKLLGNRYHSLPTQRLIFDFFVEVWSWASSFSWYSWWYTSSGAWYPLIYVQKLFIDSLYQNFREK